MRLVLTRVVVLVAVGLWSGLAFAGDRVPDRDTSNGVAPVKAPPEVSPPAAQEAGTAAATPAGPAPIPAPARQAATPAGDAQRFCQNVANAAAEARAAWQAKKLGDLRDQVQQTIADLEVREAALKATLARRDDALKRAADTLVGIFGKMKPDAAAAQLSALDDETASAVLQQLNPRAASAILDEITPDRAARLVNTIAGKEPADGKKS